MKWIMFVWCGILLLSYVSAATQLNIYLDEKGDALFLGDTTENVSLPEGIVNENGNIRGTTSSLTTKEGNQWSFSYELRNSQISVILPENAVLDSYTSGEIFLERGQIAVSDGYSIRVSYHIEKNNSGGEMISLVIVLIFILLGVYFYLKRKTRKIIDKKVIRKPVDKLKIVEGILNDRERLILNELKTLKRSKMSFLRKKTGISKAAFSRHIKELERKKLIDISGEGKNKIISFR